MIKVDVLNVFMTAGSNEFIVLLRGSEGERTLPVSIGQMEAQAIAMQINAVPFPRPLTHDLLTSILHELNCTLEKIAIIDIIDNTFYAHLFLEMGGAHFIVDSRPSDAIALALKCNAPIFVEEKVLAIAGTLLSDEITTNAQATANGVENEPSVKDSLQYRLKQAIAEERYEDAAHLRDAFKKISNSN